MKTTVLTICLLFISASFITAQEVNTERRFIEVTGSAEMDVEPDEIRFHIGIEEYWKEEYDKGAQYKDYVTKISLETIETELIAALTEIGILKNQIILKDVGQYWNRSGKDFMKSKTLELVLHDVSKVNMILSKVEVRGVSSMRISELKNKDIIRYREQVKMEAMKAAKKKAAYLLSSVDEELGQVISVIELDNRSNYYWRAQDIASNTRMAAPSGNESDQSLRKINLKYEFKVRFEIL